MNPECLDAYIFDLYLQAIFVLMTFFIWGWGIIYTLSKVSKYRGMLWGALGCLGLMLLSLTNVFVAIPDLLLIGYKGVLQFKDNVGMFLNKVKPYHAWSIATLIFQVCLIAGLAGRFKQDKPAMAAAPANAPRPGKSPRKFGK